MWEPEQDAEPDSDTGFGFSLRSVTAQGKEVC